MPCRLKITTPIQAAADKECTRYALGGVLVTPRIDGGVFLAATNSRVLAVTREYDAEADGEYIVPHQALPSSAKEIGGETSCDAEPTDDPNERERQQWTFKKTDRRKGVVSRTTEGIGGRFPKYADVIQKVTNHWLRVTIDPEMLLSAAKAIGNDNKENRGVTLFIDVPRLPVDPPCFKDLEPKIQETCDELSKSKEDVCGRWFGFGWSNDGPWTLLHSQKNVNELEAKLSKFHHHVVYQAPDQNAEPSGIAQVLLNMANERLYGDHFFVSEAMFLQGQNGIGAIMPIAPEKGNGNAGEVVAFNEFVDELTAAMKTTAAPADAKPVTTSQQKQESTPQEEKPTHSAETTPSNAIDSEPPPYVSPTHDAPATSLSALAEFC